MTWYGDEDYDVKDIVEGDGKAFFTKGRMDT